MKDRTRIEDSLALAKELLNLQQLTVAQYGLQWRHIGISPTFSTGGDKQRFFE